MKSGVIHKMLDVLVPNLNTLTGGDRHMLEGAGFGSKRTRRKYKCILIMWVVSFSSRNYK
jgi:hypothetical protein